MQEYLLSIMQDLPVMVKCFLLALCAIVIESELSLSDYRVTPSMYEVTIRVTFSIKKK